MPSEIAPSGSVACLRTPGCEIGVGTAHALGEPPRDLLDLALEAGIHGQGPARDPRHELDRPVVVGRPETARDEADVRLESLAQRRLELVGVVTDDRDAHRLEAELECLPGVERPVQVSPLAAHELAARHDDRRARAPQERGEIVRCPFFGTLTRTPATRTTTLRGDATESASLRDANLFVCPRSSVPR